MLQTATMKHTNTRIFTIIILFLGCSKDKLPEDLSSCMGDRIQSLKRENSTYVFRIDEYLFQEKKIYVLLAPQDPDALSPVLDANCEHFCSLGGLTGNTTCDGEKFSETAVFTRTVWKR